MVGLDNPVALATTNTPRSVGHSNPGQSSLNIVNRYWAGLFGRGLILRIDDVRPSNPATHPQFLDALARDFIDHGYDGKRLIRVICSSRINRLGNRLPDRDGKPFHDNIYHSSFMLQRLRADTMLGILSRIAGSDQVQNLQSSAGIQPLKEDDVNCSRNAWRERNVGWSSSLNLFPSNTLTTIMSHPGGLIEQLVKSDSSAETIARRLYLEFLSREPNADVMQQIVEHIKKTERKQAVEDIFWVLANTREFLFLH